MFFLNTVYLFILPVSQLSIMHEISFIEYFTERIFNNSLNIISLYGIIWHYVYTLKSDENKLIGTHYSTVCCETSKGSLFRPNLYS